ncbi:MAG: hypothetical protein ACUZ8H_13770 [Candidatus Anammoxibacter sp.]
MSSYKILIYLAVWKRPEITEICFKGIQRLKQYNPHLYRINTVAVVSEGWAKKLCDKYGIKWVYAENDPLGAKLNTGMDYVMEQDFDYLMTLGSDDLIDNKLLEIYRPYMDKGTEIFGTDKVCFVEGNKAKMVDYNLTIAGAGRFIKKTILQKVCVNNVKVEYTCSMGGSLGVFTQGDIGWIKKHRAFPMERKDVIKILDPAKFNLWHPDRQSALDNNSNMKLITAGASNKFIDIKEPLIVDIKSDINIWNYDYIEGEDIDINTINIPELCELENLTKG